ncbi:FAD/NAD(P)-binding protein [Mycobacterium sp. B14F4]|uniref:FAD/NAD(P)-binding protein n=1 Tax=Mycobacterium sp. B14F4 TaxID=3153565 RepID=UPI00325D41E2
MSIGSADTASVVRIALVGIGVGGTLTLSRLAEQADDSWRGTVLEIVDRPENLGRGSAFGSDIAAAAVNTSQHRLNALSPSLHSFHSWLDGSKSPATNLDEMPMPRSVYGDYLASTLAKALDRLRAYGVRVRFSPMHATSLQPRVDGMAVLGDGAELPPADIAVVAPGVWSPAPPATVNHLVNPYPLSSLRARVGAQRSVAVLGSGLTAVDVACALDDGETRVHMLSRSGTLPRVQVEATRDDAAPVHLTEDAVISLAVRDELTATAVLGLLDRELARFGFTMSDVLDDAAHTEHWADPLADPADLACHHTLSATNHALNSAFALMPQPQQRALRAALGSKWFRYRVRLPLSRWRQLRRMQDAGRLIVHAGVDANDGRLDGVLADLGVETVIPALGQSSDLAQGPALIGDLAASGLVDVDAAGQGLVDPATCRALVPGGGPRDDLLLVGQVSAGSYFTVSALDVIVRQAGHAAQTIADTITTRTRLQMPSASEAA